MNEAATITGERIKTLARGLGFEPVGITSATPADGFDRLEEWLRRGFAGDMAYMTRQAEARRDPRSILPQVRSVVMVGLNHKPAAMPSRTGRIARYALGMDYHDVLRDKLNTLLARIQQEHPGTLGRGVVDTAPLLERDFARRAGLGWIGKNTMLIHKKQGSYLFLGALLLDLRLDADAPFDAFHCGTCTRCLDACPTDAFLGPGWLDARRCISYLTIELRDPVPVDLRAGLEDWIFGCDICQEVCPWNRKAPAGTEPAFAPRAEYEALDILELARLGDAEFRRLFRGTAILRSKRRGFVRNVLLVLGNVGDASALPVLDELANDCEPIVREAALWAKERVRERGVV